MFNEFAVRARVDADDHLNSVGDEIDEPSSMATSSGTSGNAARNAAKSAPRLGCANNSGTLGAQPAM
jgi:hypothetical protein